MIMALLLPFCSSHFNPAGETDDCSIRLHQAPCINSRVQSAGVPTTAAISNAFAPAHLWEWKTFTLKIQWSARESVSEPLRRSANIELHQSHFHTPLINMKMDKKHKMNCSRSARANWEKHSRQFGHIHQTFQDESFSCVHSRLSPIQLDSAGAASSDFNSITLTYRF